MVLAWLFVVVDISRSRASSSVAPIFLHRHPTAALGKYSVGSQTSLLDFRIGDGRCDRFSSVPVAAHSALASIA